MNRDFFFGMTFGAITTWLLTMSFVGGTVFGIVTFLNQDATARYNVKVYSK
jgi:hypothetical protein